jgi:flagellar basal-body rod protein FlgC
VNLFGLMEASGSAMQAERLRAEIVATNMANAETTRTEAGEPYRRQHVIFEANEIGPEFANSLSRIHESSWPVQDAEPAGGVHIAQVFEDTAPPLKRYDPGHPDAGPDGYVAYPDINPLTEMVDLMGATRAYGLNGSAVQAEKGMINSAIDIART